MPILSSSDAARGSSLERTASRAAIATASWSIAAAHGFKDGEGIPLNAMLQSINTVVKAVELPVTADLERLRGLLEA